MGFVEIVLFFKNQELHEKQILNKEVRLELYSRMTCKKPGTKKKNKSTDALEFGCVSNGTLIKPFAKRLRYQPSPNPIRNGKSTIFTRCDGKIGCSISLFLQQSQKWKMGPSKSRKLPLQGAYFPLKPVIVEERLWFAFPSFQKENEEEQ